MVDAGGAVYEYMPQDGDIRIWKTHRIYPYRCPFAARLASILSKLVPQSKERQDLCRPRYTRATVTVTVMGSG